MYEPDDDVELIFIFVLVFFMFMSFVSPVFIITVIGLIFYVILDNTKDDDPKE